MPKRRGRARRNGRHDGLKKHIAVDVVANTVVTLGETECGAGGASLQGLGLCFHARQFAGEFEGGV